jgi:hypothetical protein
LYEVFDKLQKTGEGLGAENSSAALGAYAKNGAIIADAIRKSQEKLYKENADARKAVATEAPKLNLEQWFRAPQEDFAAFSKNIKAINANLEANKSLYENGQKLDVKFQELTDTITVLRDTIEGIAPPKEQVRMPTASERVDAAAKGTPFEAKAGGGIISGTGNTDNKLIWATSGEFMIKKSAAQKIGLSRLNQLNAYADGGVVEGQPEMDAQRKRAEAYWADYNKKYREDAAKPQFSLAEEQEKRYKGEYARLSSIVNKDRSGDRTRTSGILDYLDRAAIERAGDETANIQRQRAIEDDYNRKIAERRAANAEYDRARINAKPSSVRDAANQAFLESVSQNRIAKTAINAVATVPNAIGTGLLGVGTAGAGILEAVGAAPSGLTKRAGELTAARAEALRANVVNAATLGGANWDTGRYGKTQERFLNEGNVGGLGRATYAAGEIGVDLLPLGGGIARGGVNAIKGFGKEFSRLNRLTRMGGGDAWEAMRWTDPFKATGKAFKDTFGRQGGASTNTAKKILDDWVKQGGTSTPEALPIGRNPFFRYQTPINKRAMASKRYLDIVAKKMGYKGNMPIVGEMRKSSFDALKMRYGRRPLAYYDEGFIGIGGRTNAEHLRHEFAHFLDLGVGSIEPKLSGNKNIQNLLKALGRKYYKKYAGAGKDYVESQTENFARLFASRDPALQALKGRLFKELGLKPFAAGGMIGGVGNSDSELIRAMPGEFMVTKNAAQKIGYGNLHRLNAYADGGFVFSGATSSIGGQSVTERYDLEKQMATTEKRKKELALREGYLGRDTRPKIQVAGMSSRVSARQAPYFQGLHNRAQAKRDGPAPLTDIEQRRIQDLTQSVPWDMKREARESAGTQILQERHASSLQNTYQNRSENLRNLRLARAGRTPISPRGENTTDLNGPAKRVFQADNNFPKYDGPGKKVDVFQGFGASVNKLTASLDKLSLPTEITLTGTHQVNVIINGGEIFNQMKPEIQTMVMGEITKTLSKYNQSLAQGTNPSAINVPALAGGDKGENKGKK